MLTGQLSLIDSGSLRKSPVEFGGPHGQSGWKCERKGEVHIDRGRRPPRALRRERRAVHYARNSIAIVFIIKRLPKSGQQVVE